MPDPILKKWLGGFAPDATATRKPAGKPDLSKLPRRHDTMQAGPSDTQRQLRQMQEEESRQAEGRMALAMNPAVTTAGLLGGIGANAAYATVPGRIVGGIEGAYQAAKQGVAARQSVQAGNYGEAAMHGAGALLGGAAAVAGVKALPMRASRATGYGRASRTGDWAVMTAENPNGNAASLEENLAHNARLDAELQRRGLRFEPGTGAYKDGTSGEWLSENVRRIHGLTPGDAEALGRQFGQNSVLTNRGLHNLAENKLHPSRGTIPGGTDEVYTQIGKDRFASDLDWDNPQPLVGGRTLGDNRTGALFPEEQLRGEDAMWDYGARDLHGVAPTAPSTSRTDLSALPRIEQNLREHYTPMVQQAMARRSNGMAWYNLRPFQEAMEETTGGPSDFRLFTDLLGPTSPGTKVPDNAKQASMFYHLIKSGQLNKDDLRNGTLALPKGYANRYQGNVNKGVLNVLDGNYNDFTQRQKIMRYSSAFRGENMGSGVLDVHMGRGFGVPGTLDGEAAIGYPANNHATTGKIGSSPEDAHYGHIEGMVRDEAQRLGIPTTAYQAGGWIENAKNTNVADTRPMLGVLNEGITKAAGRQGVSEREAFERFVKGLSPLW